MKDGKNLINRALENYEQLSEKEQRAICSAIGMIVNSKKKGLVRHHWSYNLNDSADIIYLHRESHLGLHTGMIYDEKTKYYKSRDTKELLNSKKNILNI